MPWATAIELQYYLAAAGWVGLVPTDTESLLDFSGAINAAIERWNERTGYWPFLSTGVDETRRFAASALRDCLDLNGGLLTLTSLAVDCTYTNSTGTAYTHLQHFKLMPRDAPQRDKPYTYIQFIWPMQSVSDGEVSIVGKWGYCLDADLKYSAKRGVLALAACELLPQLHQALSGGLMRWTEGDRTKQFADLDKAAAGWQAAADKAVKELPPRVRIR